MEVMPDRLVTVSVSFPVTESLQLNLALLTLPPNFIFNQSISQTKQAGRRDCSIIMFVYNDIEPGRVDII